jgi:hypothetical protein
MYSKNAAGATALLAAPILAIAGALAQPTLSGDAAKQVTALTSHRGAMIAGMTLSMIAAVLLIGGTIWLAFTLAPRAPRLAMAGGVLGVLGLLIVLFENSVGAASPAIVAGLDRAQAAAVLDRIQSSAAISALEPASILGNIGVALLGIAVAKAGAPRLAAAAIVIGGLGYGSGFATGSKILVVISFALMFAGLMPAAALRASVRGAARRERGYRLSPQGAGRSAMVI